MNLADFLKKWKKSFVYSGLLSCFINILQLTFPLYMFTIYRNIVVTRSHASLFTITVAALYALMVFGLFDYCRKRLLSTISIDLNVSLRQLLFTNMLKGYAGPRKKTYFQALDDLETLQGYFSSPAIYALFDAPWAPLYLMLIYLFHPVLGIIAACGFLLILALGLTQEYLTRGKMTEANRINKGNQRFVSSVLRNAEVVNSMGMQENIDRKWAEKNQEVIVNQTLASKYAGTLQAMTKPLQNLLQVLIYGTGAWFVLQGELDVGLMVASAIIMGRALGPFMQAVSTWKLTLQTRGAYERVSRFTEAMTARPQQMNLPAPAGNLVVEKAALKMKNQFLLAGVSFQLTAGEFLGLIGPSGAGKTTLCRLLLGIWPSQGGKVRLDGVNIADWDQEELGGYIGYLPQEVELFQASLADNIARMGEVREDDLREAARLAGISDFVDSLDDGFATMVYGSQGISPSGGQKQRIGLARALYGRPRLLILDEPNSNLDEGGEEVLTAALQEIKERGDCTCIMVTHKNSLLTNMDKILVLKNGRTAMFGPARAVFRKLAA